MHVFIIKIFSPIPAVTANMMIQKQYLANNLVSFLDDDFNDMII